MIRLLCSALLFVSAVHAKSQAPVVIDFGRCRKSDRVRVYGPFGSTTYQVLGLEGSKCLLKWGSEIENPRWDGNLDHQCLVPAQFGKVEFLRSGAAGLDLTPISKYCQQRD